MNTDDTPSVFETPEWDPHSRTVLDSNFSDGRSREQLTLMDFAHRLYSVSSSNDPGIVEENNVRKEAELLMSLSYMPPINITIESGRITPPSDASSCQSWSSRHRESFRFSCPSLSLENWSHEPTNDHPDSSSTHSENTPRSCPAELLGRVLRVEDVDAMRLSSEAMARNIMQSYEKATQWRINAWVHQLSRMLVEKENDLRAQGLATEKNLRLLYESSEAMLIVRLREIRDGIKVIEACNDFHVLPRRAQSDDHPRKKQRMSLDSDLGLEGGEYQYTVSHLLTLECNLNLQAPGAGNISIDLKVPGTMNGTFISTEDGQENMTDVKIDIDTDILASMIEKSSRLVVRASVEAILKGETADKVEEMQDEVAVKDGADELQTEEPSCPPQEASEEANDETEAPEASPSSASPKRKCSEDSDAGFMIITPRNSSSPSSFGDSDHEERPILLSIPDDFSSGQKKPVIAPQTSRSNLSGITSRLPSKKSRDAVPSVVTPSKTVHNFVEGSGPGPDLPTLVEVALQLYAR